MIPGIKTFFGQSLAMHKEGPSPDRILAIAATGPKALLVAHFVSDHDRFFAASNCLV
jgi:hypothetical protein